MNEMHKRKKTFGTLKLSTITELEKLDKIVKKLNEYKQQNIRSSKVQKMSNFSKIRYSQDKNKNSLEALTNDKYQKFRIKKKRIHKIEKFMQTFNKNKDKYNTQEKNLYKEISNSIQRMKKIKTGSSLNQIIKNSAQQDINLNMRNEQFDDQINHYFESIQNVYSEQIKNLIKMNFKILNEAINSGMNFQNKYANLYKYFLTKHQIYEFFLKIPTQKFNLQMIQKQIQTQNTNPLKQNNKPKQLQTQLAQFIKCNIDLADQHLFKIHNKILQNPIGQIQEKNIQIKKKPIDIEKILKRRVDLKKYETQIQDPNATHFNIKQKKKNPFFQKNFRDSLKKFHTHCNSIANTSSIFQLPILQKTQRKQVVFQNFDDVSNIVNLINVHEDLNNIKFSTETRKKILLANQIVHQNKNHEITYKKKQSADPKLSQNIKSNIFSKINGYQFKL